MIKRLFTAVALLVGMVGVLMMGTASTAQSHSLTRAEARVAAPAAAPDHPVTAAPHVSSDISVVEAAITHVSASRRLQALSWALRQRGKPYVFGAAGPSSFDCSGLVMAAYAHARLYLPHNTVAMLDSGRLIRVSHPVRGDLAFFGTGHVELYISGSLTHGVSFGAHHSGTLIGYRSYNSYYHPSAFYRVKGAN